MRGSPAAATMRSPSARGARPRGRRSCQRCRAACAERSRLTRACSTKRPPHARGASRHTRRSS
eukprot:6864627-Prymnesium_polylepis.1